MSARDDQTISSPSGHKLYQLLGSPEKSFHQFGPPAQHVLSAEASPTFEDVWTHIHEFLTRTDPT